MFRIVGLTGTCGLDVLGRYATPYLPCGNLGVLQDQRPCGDDGSLANLTTVEQGGTHAYQGMVVDGAGMR